MEIYKTIALAGNPNVGKSTLFNALTGMNQHTGNWPGKTVAGAEGECDCADKRLKIVDLPGTYSLMAHSAEEEVARDFICFGGADAVVVVCDATCLERNLNLVLQTMEITSRVIVCVNLLDEAKRKQIHVNLSTLQKNLGIPVIGMTARSGKGIDELLSLLVEDTAAVKAAAKGIESEGENKYNPILPRYLPPIERALLPLENALATFLGERLSPRFAALRLLENDEAFQKEITDFIGVDLLKEQQVSEAITKACAELSNAEITPARFMDNVVSCLVLTAEGICCDVTACKACANAVRDRRLDRILTGKYTGVPVMLLLLAFVLWLTIAGANYPSQLLSTGLFWVQDRLTDFCAYIGVPGWLHDALVLGVFRTLAWVVSVMLPPMAIFFPLFTLLEDFGYLPRIAFNLDHSFQKAKTCGKQSLTLCMGFGCNAAGVVGCRIIDSPRERLIAILTNCFVPCNGRFPTLIAIITMFFAGGVGLLQGSVVSVLLLTGVILLGVFLTFIISRILSATILKGIPSSFALELPPYRRPQIGKVLIRSLRDRTLFVLGRAAVVAAPAGLIIWGMANITIGDMTLLSHCAAFLNPFASLLGMDGVILLGFILGFPANEIVIPIILMAYTASGSLMDISNLSTLKGVLIDNGWTWITAVSTLLFCLCHWPCSTTLLTIKKETASKKWTLLSFALPTAAGIILCFLFTAVAKLFI